MYEAPPPNSCLFEPRPFVFLVFPTPTRNPVFHTVLSFFRILWIDVMKQAACVQLIEPRAADCSLLVIALSAFLFSNHCFFLIFTPYALVVMCQEVKDCICFIHLEIIQCSFEGRSPVLLVSPLLLWPMGTSIPVST